MSKSTKVKDAVFCKCCKREVDNFQEHKRTLSHQLNDLFELRKKTNASYRRMQNAS